jgi:hypothetical protein
MGGTLRIQAVFNDSQEVREITFPESKRDLPEED